MPKDLTTSSIDRQNVLNNPYALAEIEKAAGIDGIVFEGRSVVLKEQVAAFFEVSSRTVENYLERFSEELRLNGYEVLRGNRLNELKKILRAADVPETDFGNIKKMAFSRNVASSPVVFIIGNNESALNNPFLNNKPLIYLGIKFHLAIQNLPVLI
jgi:hypothetical protein